MIAGQPLFLSMVSMVKSGGNISFLLPREVTSIEDCPADLASAISHAMRILMWFENYAPDETPPEWMWPFDDLVSDHFEEVRLKRKDRFGSGGRDSYEAADDVPMTENELTRDLRR